MMRNFLMVCAALLFTFAGSAAQLRAADTSLAARLAAAQKEFEEADKAFAKAARSLPPATELDANARQLAEVANQAIGRALKIVNEAVQADPASTISFDGLTWVLNLSPRAVSAIDLLAEHHATNPKIADSALVVAFANRKPRSPEFASTTDLLNAIVKNNKTPAAQGIAAYGLAVQAKYSFYESEFAGMPTPERDRLAKAAEDAHERVLKEFASSDVLQRQDPSERTVKESIDATLFELRNLRVGQPVPEIEAKDLDGKPMKLSEYKGKVVLLDFWAAWCPACVQDIPHQVELAKLLEGKPFAIVGVNGDDKVEAAKGISTKFKTTWRSFWNGPDGAAGPITRKWNVQSWPTTYVIDAKGIIRGRQVHGPDLDVLVQRLVAEAESAAK